MRLVYLPPYSPDFNPIEEGFSAIKAWIRSNRDYARAELARTVACNPYRMMYRAVAEAVTLEKVWGWFAHAGYVV